VISKSWPGGPLSCGRKSLVCDGFALFKVEHPVGVGAWRYLALLRQSSLPGWIASYQRRRNVAAHVFWAPLKAVHSCCD